MMFNCVCKLCSKRFQAKASNARYCPKCKLKQDEIIKKRQQERLEKKKKKQKKEKSRPFTKNTAYLICIYSYRGDSVKQIAEDLYRDEKIIKDYLKSAKESGYYDTTIKFYKELCKK